MTISPISNSPIHQTQTQTPPAKGAGSQPIQDTVHLSAAAQAHLQAGDADHDGDAR